MYQLILIAFYVVSVSTVPCVVFIQVEIGFHTVPHFKAPVNGIMEPRGPEHGGIFIL